MNNTFTYFVISSDRGLTEQLRDGVRVDCFTLRFDVCEDRALNLMRLIQEDHEIIRVVRCRSGQDARVLKAFVEDMTLEQVGDYFWTSEGELDRILDVCRVKHVSNVGVVLNVIATAADQVDETMTRARKSFFKLMKKLI